MKTYEECLEIINNPSSTEEELEDACYTCMFEICTTSWIYDKKYRLGWEILTKWNRLAYKKGLDYIANKHLERIQQEHIFYTRKSLTNPMTEQEINKIIIDNDLADCDLCNNVDKRNDEYPCKGCFNEDVFGYPRFEAIPQIIKIVQQINEELK